MKMPSFTAEASLSGVKDRYALSLGHTAEDGMVLPQYCIRRCVYTFAGEFCWFFCWPIPFPVPRP